MTTFSKNYNNFALLMVRGDKSRIILDIDEIEVVHHWGLGSQVVIDEVTFWGANLNFYHDDREHIDILADWGWKWDEENVKSVHTSIEEMPEDLRHILVTALAKRLLED